MEKDETRQRTGRLKRKPPSPTGLPPPAGIALLDTAYPAPNTWLPFPALNLTSATNSLACLRQAGASAVLLPPLWEDTLQSSWNKGHACKMRSIIIFSSVRLSLVQILLMSQTHYMPSKKAHSFPASALPPNNPNP